MLRLRSLAVLAALALPLAYIPAVASAHGGRGGGKKPMGTIASYDGTTLTVTLADGSTETATTTDGTRVKIEHRGNHSHGRGHGNPSKGSLDDLSAGAFVLRMKLRDDTLEQIRIRPSETDAGSTCAADDESDDSCAGSDDSSGEDASGRCHGHHGDSADEDEDESQDDQGDDDDQADDADSDEADDADSDEADDADADQADGDDADDESGDGDFRAARGKPDHDCATDDSGSTTDDSADDDANDDTADDGATGDDDTLADDGAGTTQ